MAERIDLLIRAALHALALLYPTGKVTLIEWFAENQRHPYEVVNVDVTDRPELREQLAEAIITCDQYHVHDPECFPWERWTSDKGVIYRGMVGKLLTMWIRIEEVVGHEPVTRDPVTVPAPREPEQVDGPLVRPYVTEHLAAAAGAGALGIARVDGDLTPAPEPHPLAELADAGPLSVPVVPGDTAEEALRRWVGASIESELLRGGPFGRRTDALAAVRAHPAADMIDDETALGIAEVLVRDSRPRRSWWTLGSILGGAQ